MVLMGHRRWRGLLLVCLLGLLPQLALGQGQLINGNRTLAGALNFCFSGGGANAYTCTLNPAITAYQNGQCILFLSNAANTGPSTLAVNGLSAVPIRKGAPSTTPVNLVAGDIGPNQMVSVCHDSVEFQLMGTIGVAPAGGSGTVNAGVAGAIPYYPGAGSTIDDSLGLQLSASAILSEMHQVTSLAADTPLAVHNIIACTAGATNKTFTLPPASTTSVGLYRVIKVDTGAGACVVQTAGSDSLNGVTSGSLSVNQRHEELWVTFLPALPGWTATPRKLQWNLGTDVTGNLSVNNLNGGLSASSTTVWCGNGTWCTPPGGSGGGIGISGTPVAGQTAEWVSGSVIQGVTTTGSGAYVKNASPTLVTPTLGVATATSINGTSIPASAILSTINGTPVAGQAAEWVSGSVIQGVTTTGSGAYVKNASPTLITPNLGVASATSINGTPIPASATIPTLGSTNVWTGRQDATGAASTAPNKAGTTLPGTCGIADTFFKTDALAGSNTYACTAPNVWTLQGASDTGTVTLGSPNASVRYNAADTTVGPSTGLTLSPTKVLTSYNNVLTITANTTLDQHNIVRCVAGGGTVTATLPLASAATAGHYTVIKDDAIGICQIARSGTDTFNGVAGPLQLTKQYDAIVVEILNPGTPGLWWYTGVKAQLGYVHLGIKGADLPTSNAAIIQVDEPRPKLVFDAVTSWCTSWTFTMNPDYGVAPVVVYKYYMTFATSGSTKMDWSVWKTTPAQAEGAQSPGYDTANTCTDATVPGTAGRVAQVACPLTTNDAMLANDQVTLKACRNVTGTGLASGNMNMISAQLQYFKQ